MEVRTIYDDWWVTITTWAIGIKGYAPFRPLFVIPFSRLRGIEVVPLSRWQRWQLYGTHDGRIWWTPDRRRFRKERGILLDVAGRRMRIGITPARPERVAEIVRREMERNR